MQLTSETRWGAFEPLKAPIDFIVTLNSKEATATLLGFVNDALLNVFRLQFSDGYIDDFIMSEAGTVCAEKGKTGIPYATAVQKDLDCLCLLSVKDDFFNFQFELNGKTGNLWVIARKRDEQPAYSIYSDGDYHFHLIERGGQWEPVNVRTIDPRPIDKRLHNEVIGRLELSGRIGK